MRNVNRINVEESYLIDIDSKVYFEVVFEVYMYGEFVRWVEWDGFIWWSGNIRFYFILCFFVIWVEYVFIIY